MKNQSMISYYLWHEKFYNIFLLILITIKSLVKTFTAITLSFSLNAVVAYQMQDFLFWTLLNIILWILWISAMYAVNILQEKVIQRMIRAIRLDIVSRLSHVTYQTYYEQTDSTYASWLTTDMKTIEDTAFLPFYQIVDASTLALFSSIGLLSFHYSVLGLTLLCAILIAVVPNSKNLRNFIQKASLRQSKENELFLSRIYDTLKGFNEFFTFNRQDEMVESVNKSSYILMNERIVFSKKYALMTVLITILNISSQLIVNSLTGLLIIKKYIPVGALLSVGQLSGNVFNALGNISNYLMSISSSKLLFDKFTCVQVYEEKQKKTISQIDTICFHNVNYDYGAGNVFGNPVSMIFQKGGKYAIIGNSGAGKSTLMNILTKKIDSYSGSLMVNDYELKDISGYAIREQIASVNQSTYIFEATIKENIEMGKVVSPCKLEDALLKCGMKQVLEKLPEGINSIVGVGNDGINLSGGQRQRIALARAITFNRNIIILDEGTSALDPESAMKIEDILMDNPEITVIIITHHLNANTQKKLTAIYEI